MENNSQKIKEELEKKNTLARIRASYKIGGIYTEDDIRFLSNNKICVDCLKTVTTSQDWTTDTENGLTAFRHADCKNAEARKKTKLVPVTAAGQLFGYKIPVEVLTKEGWQDVEYGSWDEIIKEGWKFLGMERTGTVVMVRQGYINEFRNKKEASV